MNKICVVATESPSGGRTRTAYHYVPYSAPSIIKKLLRSRVCEVSGYIIVDLEMSTKYYVAGYSMYRTKDNNVEHTIKKQIFYKRDLDMLHRRRTIQ